MKYDVSWESFSKSSLGNLNDKILNENVETKRNKDFQKFLENEADNTLTTLIFCISIMNPQSNEEEEKREGEKGKTCTKNGTKSVKMNTYL